MTYGGVCVSYCPNSASSLPKCPPELNTTDLYDPVLGEEIIGDYCSYTRIDNPNSFPPTYSVEAVSAILKFQVCFVLHLLFTIIANCYALRSTPHWH
jgi:hypothetical protein